MLSFGRRKSARGGLRAALLAGATVGAFALVSVGGASPASASLNCGGSAITGAGSSLQKVAEQNVWSPGFSGASGVCPSGPTVTYESIGSGGGLAFWNATGVLGHINTEKAFIGTDDAPNPTQIASTDSVADGAHVVVIPVAQTSIAIVANLPAGCSFAEETGITNLDLQKVFRGSLKTWSGLETTEGTCNSPITRVVRKDGSGTTFQFKTYLSRMNGGVVAVRQQDLAGTALELGCGTDAERDVAGKLLRKCPERTGQAARERQWRSGQKNQRNRRGARLYRDA